MKRAANKAGFVLIGVLVALACVPFAFFPDPATAPPTGEPLHQGTPNVTSGATSTQLVTVPTSTVTLPVQPTHTLLSSELYAFIKAPEGPLSQPFVTLIAFQSIPDPSLEIQGIVNSKEFICSGSPCALPVLTSSTVVFRAVSDSGFSSEEISATVRVELGSDGYYVYLDTVSQFASFSDSCLRFWDFQDYTNPEWAEFVQFPYLINTNKTLHYLATRLIIHGIVSVAGCSDGGLSAGLDWPTACGLERASSAMIEWQNQYDEYIWLASSDVGIPPKILKTLMEVESQFWPGNKRFFLDEIGLGQVTQVGVDVLLRTDPALYQQICLTVLGDCDEPYHQLSDEDQALIRGAFLDSQNSLCESCQYGLDLDLAKQSVNFVAQVLQANCKIVKQIADENQPADYIDELEDPYSDFWKFTLFSYHSGTGCFEQAVEAVPDNTPLDWENLSQYIDCEGGKRYVDGVWGNLLSFDLYRYTTTDQDIVQVNPVFAATRTPFPTAVQSTARILVQVFLDSNQNGIAEVSEWMNIVPVLLEAEDGAELRGSTVDGRTEFELADFPIGSDVTVSLPGLYRSETITVPAQGEVPVIFIFMPPTLPTAIP